MWKKPLAIGITAVLIAANIPITSHASGTVDERLAGQEKKAEETVSGSDNLEEALEYERAWESPGTVSGNAGAEEHTVYMDALEESAGRAVGYDTYLPYEGAKYSLCYSVGEDGITITGITDYESKESGLGELVIPAEINGIAVMEIGYGAFDSCSGFIGNLSIPEGVKSIGDGAFWCCNGLTGSINIPEGVTAIGNSAFYGCSGFTGNLSIPEGVTTIANAAFCDCSGLTGSLVIPEGVKLIGYKVFEGCSGFTGSLVIPEGVTIIGEGAFYGCSGFNGSLVIPEGVTIIDAAAFRDCSGLMGSLIIPDSVRIIGNSAFNGCSGFTGSLVIPEGMTAIDGCAFSGCSGFDGELVLPDSMTTIDNGAFEGCSGFTGSLVIPKGVTKIGDFAFSECSGFTGSLVIPEGMTEICGAAFKGCSGLSGSLVIPEGVTRIGNDAFQFCNGLTGSLNIPNSVTAIGDCAFDDCYGFTGSLVIPNSVTAIGDCAFMGCYGFTGSLRIPDGVTEIGDWTFIDCSGFTGNLVIPEGVTTIGEWAFSGCSGFTGSVVIPESVELIYGGAFSDCSGLTSITFLGIPAYISHKHGGALGPVIFIYGYRGSIVENYVEISNETREISHRIFIPLTEAAAKNPLELIVSGLNTKISATMSYGEKLTLLTAVLASQGMLETAKETALKIEVSETTLQNDDKKVVDAWASAKGMTTGQYLDITMNLWIGGESQTIADTDIPVRITIEVPKELRQEGRKFAAVRVHDGKAEILEDLDDNPLTVTIETDRFSSYTLVYRDTGGTGSITGTVTCYNNVGTATIITLTAADGVEDARITVAGSSAAYSLQDLAEGEYTLKVSRNGHTTREYTVTVADEALEQDVEIRLLGDVNGDGEMDAKDKRIIYNHMDAPLLTGYEFLVGDVDGSGEIDARDKRMIFNHIAGNSLLW